eukprot:m.52060 g.52060  ORF g.52060 m.52060 type:complete len:1783 (+) comp12674_c1_seq1:372-5720(+)
MSSELQLDSYAFQRQPRITSDVTSSTSEDRSSPSTPAVPDSTPVNKTEDIVDSGQNLLKRDNASSHVRTKDQDDAESVVHDMKEETDAEQGDDGDDHEAAQGNAGSDAEQDDNEQDQEAADDEDQYQEDGRGSDHENTGHSSDASYQQEEEGDDDDEEDDDEHGEDDDEQEEEDNNSDSGSDAPANLRSNRQRKQRFARQLDSEIMENPELFGLRRSGRERRQRQDYLQELYTHEEEEAKKRKTRASKKTKTRESGRSSSSRQRRGRRVAHGDDSDESEGEEDDDNDDTGDEEDYGSGHEGSGRRQRNASASSDASEEWNPGTTTRRSAPRQKRARRQKRASSDDDYGYVPQRASFRNTTRSINYRESDSDQDLDEVSDSEIATRRQAIQAEDNRDKIEIIVTNNTRQQLVDEMNRLFALQAVIDEQEPLPAGKTLEEVQSDIDSSLVSILGKSSSDAEAIAQAGTPTDTLFCIKWAGRSHLHNTWVTENELRDMDIVGLKKLDNYLRDLHAHRATMDDPYTTTEDREYINCQLEMHFEALAKHKLVERIVMNRTTESTSSWDQQEDVEYFCKWVGLDYSDNTWEPATLICPRFQTLVDEFLERQSSNTLPTPKNKKQTQPFKVLKTQPSWLPDPNLQLRDYQLQGVSWIAKSWCDGNSVILADEMGLGKTIQSVVFLSYLFHVQKVYGPFLIVVPLSTIMAWARELHKWAPDMNAIVYIGNKKSREVIHDFEFYNDRGKVKFNVVLTTYETVNKNIDDFLPIHWASLLVDEAHRLKNHESCLHQALSQLRHNHRLLITGTPLQNSLKELWALLHFIMPKIFDSWDNFEEHYGGLSDDVAANHKVLGKLHEDIKPYLLRRVKKDVEKSLPKKVEQILRVGLSQMQKQIYKHILTKNYTALRNIQRGQKSSLVNIIMELKKCCNHSSLIDQAPLTEPTLSAGENLRNLLKGSGKLILLDKLLQRLREKGHRVLIFSQMVMMLDVIATYLMMRGYPFQRLDGNIPNERRKQAIDHFNAPDSQDFCFILSTRAGGLGVNLATADTVIIFDSDWNPQNDLQAQARAHRIGQTKQVNIYRFVSKKTVEEDILERAKKKMVLDHLVIQRMDTTGSSLLNLHKKSSGNVEYNKDELDAILKFGAADLFGEQDANEGTGDQDLKLDLDTVLEQAETHDTNEAAVGMSDELLSAFKTVDIETNEEELDAVARAEEAAAAAKRAKQEAAAAAVKKAEASAAINTWDDIIPQDVRHQVLAEEHAKEMEKLMLPPRKRKQPVSYTGADTEDADSAGSRSKPLPELTEAGVGSFTAEELRSLVIALRKHGCFDAKAKTILDEAHLTERKESEVKKLVDWLRQETAKKKKIADAEKDAKKKKELRLLTLGKQNINAEEFLLRVEGLTLLHKLVSNSTGPFRVHTKVKLPNWDCDWKPTADAALLVGVDKYGVGSWEQMKNDSSLNLASLILPEDPKQKPQDTHLRGRVETLLKELLKTKRRPTLPMTTSKAAKAASTLNKTKQASVKQFVEKRPSKSEPRTHGSDDDFQKKQPSQKTIAAWMDPVSDSIKILQSEANVDEKSRALIRVGDFINDIRDQHEHDYDKNQLKNVLWLHVARIAHPADAEKQSKTLRKVYRAFKHKEEGEEPVKSQGSSKTKSEDAKSSSSPAAKRRMDLPSKSSTDKKSTSSTSGTKFAKSKTGHGSSNSSSVPSARSSASSQKVPPRASSGTRTPDKSRLSRSNTSSTSSRPHSQAASASSASPVSKRKPEAPGSAKRPKLAGQTTLDRFKQQASVPR